MNCGRPTLELKLNLSPPIPKEASSGEKMMLVGCPRCLMYVMLLENDPKCPKCKSRVLLDFLQEGKINTSLTK